MRLDVYWKAMNLNFHKNTEDANASLAILSLYLDTLTDYFQFYAALQKQSFNQKENHFINLQSFFHFLKLFKFCSSKEEIASLAQKLEDSITPLEDTLNIMNGINFAMFLECILQTAYYKVQ